MTCISLSGMRGITSIIDLKAASLKFWAGFLDVCGLMMSLMSATEQVLESLNDCLMGEMSANLKERDESTMLFPKANELVDSCKGFKLWRLFCKVVGVR